MHLFTHLFTCVLIHSSPHAVYHPFLHSFTHSSLHSLNRSFILLVVPSLLHSCVHPFTPSFSHFFSLGHTFICSPSHSFIYYHSFIPPIRKPSRGLLSQLSPQAPLCSWQGIPPPWSVTGDGEGRTERVGWKHLFLNGRCFCVEGVCLWHWKKRNHGFLWIRSPVSETEPPWVPQATCAEVWMSTGGQVTWLWCPWSLVTTTKGPYSPTPVHAIMRGL